MQKFPVISFVYRIKYFDEVNGSPIVKMKRAVDNNVTPLYGVRVLSLRVWSSEFTCFFFLQKWFCSESTCLPKSCEGMTTSASVILQIFHSFRMHFVTDSLNPASILSLRVVNPPPPYIQQLVDVEKSYLFNIHYRDSVAVNLMNSEWCTIALTSGALECVCKHRSISPI